jgi:hypothetical protein
VIAKRRFIGALSTEAGLRAYITHNQVEIRD